MIRVAVRDQREFLGALSAQAEAFEGEVEIVALPIEACEAMASGGGEAGFDLLLSSTDWVAAGVRRGVLGDVSGFLASDPPEGWPDGWHSAMHKLISFEGVTVGLPYHDGPQVLHYRGDLFEDEGVRGRFREACGRELGPPDTWSEFLEVARFFAVSDLGVAGCCFGGYPDGHNNVFDFLVHLWSRGGEYFDEAGEPVFDSVAGVEGLAFYRDLVHRHGVAPRECLGLNSVQSGDFYAQGRAAMMWNWSGFALIAENPEGSKIVGLNRTTKIPQGDGEAGRRVSINSYWVMAMLAGSGRKRESWRFLKFLGSAEQDLAAAGMGINGVRLSTWESAEVQARYPVYRLMAEVHDGSRALPRRTDYVEVNRIVSEAIDDVLNLRAEPGVVLAAAAERVRGLG